MTNNIELDSFSASLNEHSVSNEHGHQASPAEMQVAQANSTQQPAPAASEPVPVDVGGAPVKPEAPAEAKAPPAAAPHEYVADASHVVRLPANASIDNIKVDGQNLVLEQADGSVIVIKDGALNVPTFIIGDVEVPRVALLAALEASHVDVAFGADGSMSAGPGGSNSSAGGDFSVPPGGIGDGFDLSALLPPTALQFGLLERRELFPSIVDRQVSVTATSLLAPTEAASEAGLDGGGAQSPGSEALTDNETSSTGTISIDAPDGIGSIVINGVTVTSVNQQIPGEYGYLTIVSFNPSTGAIEYNYTVTESVIHTDQTAGYDPNNDTVPDNFSITVTDVDGDSASTTFAVAIVDDAPTAVADTDSVTEDGATVADGNVITASGGADANVTDGVADVRGADGATVTGVEAGTVASASGHVGSAVGGSYGSITIDADGHYSYTLNNGAAAVQALTSGQHLTDTFTYTLTDGDGDTSTTTVEITINGTNDVPQVVVNQGNPAGAHDQVYEAGLAAGSAAGDGSTVATGTFTVSDADGLDDVQTVTIGGVTVAIGSLNGSAFQGDHGTLLITGYNPATGVATYQYTLTSTTTDVPAVTETDSFSLTVSDGTSSSVPAAIVIDIVDDVPNAVNDTNSISEDALSPVNGNVLTNDLHANNQPGADTPTSFVSWDGSTTGAHGTFVANPDGTYTYTLNNADPAVQALDAGQTLTETFNYTMKDADGDTDTATLTITINGTNDVPQIVVDQGNPAGAHDQVYEAGLAAGSAAGDGSTVATGTFTVSDADGLDDVQTVTIGGVTVAIGSLNGSAFQGDHGTLLITGYNPATGVAAYQYTLTSTTTDVPAVTETDSFSLTVSDGTSSSAPAAIVIDIVDDVPTAHANTNSVSEGAQASGNVLTDGTADVLGADGAAPGGAVTGVATGSNVSNPVSGNLGGAGIAGQYGTLVLGANGAYTYTANPNAVTTNAVDHFVYTITDGDGDTSTVTLDITVNNVTVTASDTDALVSEKGLATGSDAAGNSEIFNGAITPAGGTGPYTYTLTSPASGSYGNLVLNANGTYTYTLTQTYDGATTNNGITTEQDKDSFTYTVTDAHGNTTTGSILVDIVDDIPTAHANTNSVSEGAQASGNVLTDGTADVLGADGAAPGGAVTGVATGSNVSNPVSGNLGGAGIAGQYGTLVLGANGAYTYTANPNAVTTNAVDHFVYTITDGDGDTSTVTLDITVNNVTVTASDTDALVSEKGLATGSDAAGNSEIFNGAITPAGGTGPYTYTLTSPASGSYGNLVLNANGTYTYTLTQTYDGVTTNNGITTEQDKDSFTYTVTDAHGNTTTGSILVDIVDDMPTAHANTNSVSEGAQASGNVLTDGTADVLGADGAAPGGAVTGVATGSNVSNPVSGNLGGAGIAGQYGTLVLGANGAYTYTANPNAVTTNAVDHFVYTITDGDGDTSTVTLDITVNNVTVTASDTDALVSEKGLATGSDAAGNSEIFNGAITPAGGTGPYTYTLTSPASGSYGNLVLNANGTYTYTLTQTYDGATTNNGITTEQDKDSFTYTVTDAHGNTTTGSILVDIVDDIPTAHANTNSVSEGAQASGNVLTDGTADVLGADGAAPGGAVTGVATGSNVSNPVSGNLGGAGIAGQYGTLVLGANGAYTYTANPNAVTTNAVDHFVYTITDGDGDTSTVTLDITVNNVTVTASDTDALVSEKGLATGSDAAGNSEIFNGAITPAGGTGPYTYTLTSPASGSYGNLVLNANGTYTYTLTQTYDGATTNNGITTEQDKDSFTYTVTDAHGNTTTGSILVDIVDDVPTAHANTNSVSEGAQASGNVLTDGTADVLGADGAAPGGAVTGVATGSNVSNPVSGNLGGAGIAGQYGTLVLGANGAYTYTANPNAVTTNAVDHFVYTITDGDGDTSTVTLDITVNNVTVTASDTDALVSEKGLATGSDAAGNSEIFNGAITPAGGTGPYTYTLTSPASGSYGNLVLNANGTYTYTLTQTYDGATTNNGITTEQDKDSFTYTVTDAHGNTTTGSILVDIVDDIPTAHANTNSVSEGAQASGNVLTDGTADVLGADGAAPGGAVTGVATGSNVSNPVSGNLGGAGIAGQYGTLVLGANGAYTYTANPNAVTTNAVDHFVYTITDGDGDTSTVTLDITVNNVTVTASDTDALVSEKGLATGSDAAGNSEIFNGAITPAGGTGPYTYTLTSPASGSYGNLVLNANGTYTYTLTQTYDGATTNNGITTEQDKDSFTYTVTDAHGNTTTGSILVDIVDDIPTAHANTNSVSEGAQASGNVLTDGTADVLGADGAAPGGAVTGVATGSNVSNPVSGNLGGAGIAGQYGTLVLGANGAYTYTANPNAVTTNAVDHFVYTITDGDGDTSTVTLDITVNNVTVTASDTDALVSEKGLATGSDAAGNSEIFNGAITPAGGTGPYTYTLTSPASGSYGNLVLNANGTYTYTLTQTYDGATTNNGITTEQDKDSFTYTVTDAHGNTTTGSILVDIVDDVPTLGAFTPGTIPNEVGSVNGLFDFVAGADGVNHFNITGPAITGVSYSTAVQADGTTVLLAETSTGTDIYSLTLHPDGTYAFALITPDAATTVTQTLTGLSPGGPTPFLETSDGLIEFTGTGTGVNSSTQGFGVADQFIEKDENFTMEFHTSATAGDDAPTLNPKFIGSLDFAASGNSSGSVSWIATNSVTGETRSGTATVTNGHLVIDPSIDFNLISITGDAGSKIRLSAVDISQTILPSDTTLHFQVSAVDGDGDVSATQSLDIHQVAASSGGSFTLAGFAGTVNDVIAGSTHADTISGGAGTDIADYTGSAAISINLTDAGGAAGVHGTPSNPSDGNITGGDATGDTLTGIEGLIGGSGDDYLYGNSGANYLAGGLGNDTLRGEGGADTLIGGAGNDLLVGGAGSDTLTGGTGTDTFRLENLDIKDLITDFNGGDGDKIDLTALFDSAPANVGNFVNYDAGTGVLSVDTSGSGDPANFVQVAELTNHPAANTITLLYDDGITQHQTTANVV